MRLTESERHALLTCGQALLTGPWTLELFGSRIDDHLRGGDIDLLFTFADETALKAALTQKWTYLARIKGHIGEQKIDVVMTTPARAALDPFIAALGDRRIPLGHWPPPDHTPQPSAR